MLTNIVNGPPGGAAIPEEYPPGGTKIGPSSPTIHGSSVYKNCVGGGGGITSSITIRRMFGGNRVSSVGDGKVVDRGEARRGRAATFICSG